MKALLQLLSVPALFIVLVMAIGLAEGMADGTISLLTGMIITAAGSAILYVAFKLIFDEEDQEHHEENTDE